MDTHTFDFESEFVNVDFDSILTRCNNPLANSNEKYLIFKQRYLDETYKNKHEFEMLIEKAKVMQNPSIESKPNRISYVVYDQDLFKQIQFEAKSIVYKQRQLFNNFVHYVNTLNDTDNRTNTQQHQTKSEHGRPNLLKRLSRSMKKTTK